jgi:hypothetical protein
MREGTFVGFGFGGLPRFAFGLRGVTTVHAPRSGMTLPVSALLQYSAQSRISLTRLSNMSPR